MPAPVARSHWLVATALVAVLVAQAIALILDPPWSEGSILVVLTATHGVTAGDLPSAGLLAFAALMCAVVVAGHIRRR